MSERRPSEQTLQKVQDHLVNESSDDPYMCGVRDALGWVLGDYHSPEGLPSDLQQRIERWAEQS